MRICPKLLAIVQLGALVWSVLAPQFAFAYEHPLSDEAVRDAYSLGQNLNKANTFLSQYVHTLPVPTTGPHIAEIELSTPYAQVVEVSAQHTVGYSGQQAARDYRRRGDFIIVRVKILFTPTYTGHANDFWRGVSIELGQNIHMAATRVDGQPIYASNSEGGSWLIGANVLARFSVAGVKSDSLQVEVAPPEGPAVHATFDLNGLR